MPMPVPSITTVIFDFDGVLADTERLHLRAFQQVFAERGWTLDEAAYFDQYLGYDDRGLVLAFGDDQTLGLTARDVQTLVSAKGKVFGDYVAAGDVVFPKTRACVERMAQHFKLGIASGALQGEIVTILEAAKLRHFFAAIVAADDVTACKPAPEPYLTAAQRLGVLPLACAAVEDSPPGLAAARTAGMRTVGITTTTTADLLTLADRVIHDLDELTPDLVAGLGPAAAV
ncbi:MAG: HAD family phosphatase [Acidobacteriota bacterium]